MKTSVNNLDVFVFKPSRQSTMLPQDSVDENGASFIVHVETSDEDIPRLPYEQCQLKALLSAGVDPSSMRINTTAQSRVDVVNSIDNAISQLNDSFFEMSNQEQSN